MTDSDSDPKSRRWFITALVAGGLVFARIGRRLLDEIAGGAAKIGGIFELWREIRPRWFVKARWSFKAFYFYTILADESLQKQLEIPPGDYATIALDTDKRSQLKYDVAVSTGPRIDVLLFSEEEYGGYIGNESADHVSAASNLDTRDCTEEYRFSPLANYLLVLDNSDRSKAESDGRNAALELSINLETI